LKYGPKRPRVNPNGAQSPRARARPQDRTTNFRGRASSKGGPPVRRRARPVMPRPLKGRLAAVIAPAATMSPARRCWISRPDSLRLLTSSTRCPLVRIVHELTRLRAGLLVGYIERGGVAFEAVDAGTSPQEARGGECQASQRRRQDTPQSLSGDHWQALCRGAGWGTSHTMPPYGERGAKRATAR
jgi:hypothetical protein